MGWLILHHGTPTAKHLPLDRYTARLSMVTTVLGRLKAKELDFRRKTRHPRGSHLLNDGLLITLLPRSLPTQRVPLPVLYEEGPAD